MRSILIGALASAFVSTLAFAAGPPETDAQFVEKASVGNTFEIEEAKLAEQQASDPALKDFAQRMVKDHSEAMSRLESVATQANQKAEMKLDAPHQAMVDNLKKYKASDFDKIYLADQIAAHVETQNLLMDYKQNGKNGDLKTWARDTLPTVQDHLGIVASM